MKKYLRRFIPFSIGISLAGIYHLIRNYMNGTMTVGDIVVNVALLIISWLIIKDMWKYGEED